MNENLCPYCQEPLQWNGHYTCSKCDQAFNKIGYCPKCSIELEKLQACGAVNYFCNQCNELKSSASIQFEFKEFLLPVQ